MAATDNVILTGSWQAIATAGEVLVTAYGLGSSSVSYAITNDATAPTGLLKTHNFEDNKDKSMTLTGTERLWVKGVGAVARTADAPV